LSLWGPADGHLAFYAIGGGENPDCNHSDWVEYDCVEKKGKVGKCDNTKVGAAEKQTCLDIIVGSTTICTQNLCTNATEDQWRSGQSCKKLNCGT
jgi:hypothetical protein